MTRLWNVTPRWMCDEHLCGEHGEMHQAVGTIRNHSHGVAVIEGLAEDDYIDTSLIQQRHDELAAEIERRGFEHDSPMAYDDSLNVGAISETSNFEDLMDRCDDCHNRYMDSA